MVIEKLWKSMLNKLFENVNKTNSQVSINMCISYHKVKKYT